MTNFNILQNRYLKDFSPEFLIRLKGTCLSLIKAGVSNNDIYEYLENTEKLDPIQSREFLAYIFFELKNDSLYDRQASLASAVYFIANQIVELKNDLNLLDATLNVVTVDKDGNLPGINMFDPVEVNSRIDLIGKTIDRKKRLRDGILSYRKELDELLRLKVDSDMLKSIQLLMTSNVLPEAIKDRLYNIFASLDENINTLILKESSVSVDI